MFVEKSALPIFPDSPCFRQRVPLTNFPAWPGQSSVQPMFVEKFALSIFPNEPVAAQICATDSPPCWHGCRCPNVRTNSLFCQALDYPVCPDSPSADSVDFADFVGAADSNTAPTMSKPALFLQRVPSMNFPAWPGQSIVQPMFVEKSALPILPDEPAAAQICAADFPPVGMVAAAAAHLSGPTVFSVKPWTINRPDS
jgi:hypothetical protein